MSETNTTCESDIEEESDFCNICSTELPICDMNCLIIKKCKKIYNCKSCYEKMYSNSKPIVTEIYKKCCVCFDNKVINDMDAINCCESGFICHECVCEYICSNHKNLKNGSDGFYEDWVEINCFVCRKKHRIFI